MAALPALLQVLFALLGTVTFMLLSALLLWVSAKRVRLANKSYKTALLVAAIAGAVQFLWGLLWPSLKIGGTIMSLILGFPLIKHFYQLEWNKTIKMWAIWVVFVIILATILNALFALLSFLLL